MDRSPVQRTTAPASRAAVPVAVVALLVIAAFGAYLRFADSSPLGIDSWWGDVVRVTRGSAPYAIAVFFAEIGTAVGAAAIGAVAIALLLVLRRKRDAASVATAMLLGVAGSELTKALVLRPRPSGALYSTSGSSYPSGHSMGAAALACSLALVVWNADRVSEGMRRLAWALAAAWTLIMMWSRTALHVHWLSDTICGALLGLAAALLARRIWTRRDVPGASSAPGAERRVMGF